ncbi:hypothetical protein BZA77DRAFT_83764 [Pyronema omphalodes]|nr:hypothetical protein BZA77DRAFT_83764 [Pyronema omphalodes]
MLLLLALLLSPATSTPLPPPSLQRRDDEDPDDDPDDKDDNHQLAIIISCSLVGILIFGAVIMYTFFFFRRRRQTGIQGSIPSSSHNDNDNEKKQSPSSPRDNDAGISQTQCSWCYISDQGLCKWCSGEASDDEDVTYKRSEQTGLFLKDTKHNGWRSAIMDGMPSARGSVAPSVSGASTPAPVIMGREGREGRDGRCIPQMQQMVVDTQIQTQTQVLGKRSFRPGGIYEVQPSGVSVPEKAVVRGWE